MSEPSLRRRRASTFERNRSRRGRDEPHTGLKTAITKLGFSPSGLPIYRFAYKTDPTKFYKGVMAQDLLEVKPEAVVKGADGYYKVNYGLLDVARCVEPTVRRSSRKPTQVAFEEEA